MRRATAILVLFAALAALFAFTPVAAMTCGSWSANSETAAGSEFTAAVTCSSGVPTTCQCVPSVTAPTDTYGAHTSYAIVDDTCTCTFALAQETPVSKLRGHACAQCA